MWFVLIVLAIVIAGWIYMSANADPSGTRAPTGGSDDYVAPNPYENPYDTNENNDRPFEPDSADDASGACSTDDAGGGGDGGD